MEGVEKQTAVEFIETELRKLNISIDSGTSVSVIRIFDKALEMEKEQLIDAYDNTNSMAMNGEQYYNETFKSE